MIPNFMAAGAVRPSAASGLSCGAAAPGGPPAWGDGPSGQNAAVRTMSENLAKDIDFCALLSYSLRIEIF